MNKSPDKPSAIDEWLAAEAAQIAQREAAMAAGSARGAAAFGAVPLEAARMMDGLSMMQAMLRGEFPAPPIGKTMDFLLVEIAAGRAVFQGRPGPAYMNPMGGLHGGWYATLLDSALGCAVHTMMPAGRGYTTAELGINLVRAITPKVQRVRAIGEVQHCGRQLATATARLVGPDGTLYAHGSTTCLVFELAPQSKS